MFKTLNEDIDAAFGRDPAVRSRLEVVLCYPSFHAILFYRLGHALWVRKLFLLGRFVSHLGRFFTGIEIHPAAVIGRGFFVDHGLGVVIGETAEIGDDVTLYHDVTLGGIAPAVDAQSQVNQKRHPTIEDGVIIGSGAQILGPITVGAGARVGANSVVLKNVAPNVTVVGIPARVVAPKARRSVRKFDAYGTPTGDIPDPMAKVVEGLLEQVNVLTARLEDLERGLARSTGSDASFQADDEAGPGEETSRNHARRADS